jgi:thiol-disulfide isomerase/thioredoxin
MPNLTTRRRFHAVSALMTLSAATVALSATAQTPDPAAQAAHSSSGLSDARTIQLKETFSIQGKEGKLMPYFAIGVKVERPNKVRLDVTPLTKSDKPQKPILYISDGKTQHEFNGSRNQFRTSDAPGVGEPATSQYCSIAGIDLILNPGLPPQDKGVKRAVTPVTVEGHNMMLTTDTEPTRKTNTGASFTVAEQTWTDASTGLPYRHAVEITEGNKTNTVQQTDFTDWALNKPIAAEQFVWTAPPGAKEYIEPKLLTVGTPAPDFAAVTPDGKTVHLSDLKGKPIIIDFWATWCGPCQQSMPHLQKVYEQVKSKGVQVLAVCVWDQRPEYDKWVIAKKGTYTFPTVFDPAGRGDDSIAGKLYGVSGIPTQYVIDKNGNVAAVNVGYETGDTKLEEALGKLGIEVKAP